MTVHTYPVNDLIEHNTDSDDCVCGPTILPIERGDGSISWQILHNSMDGREFSEPDYEGPPMPTEEGR